MATLALYRALRLAETSQQVPCQTVSLAPAEVANSLLPVLGGDSTLEKSETVLC